MPDRAYVLIPMARRLSRALLAGALSAFGESTEAFIKICLKRSPVTVSNNDTKYPAESLDLFGIFSGKAVKTLSAFRIRAVY